MKSIGASGARMVGFGGGICRCNTQGIVDEHNTVRNAVGLFDVSHMGEIEIRGPEALRLVDTFSTNAASRLKAGQAHYSGLLYEHGGFVDDILVHKVADNSYFLCVNASDQDKDFEHIRSHNHFDCEWISRVRVMRSWRSRGRRLSRLHASSRAPISTRFAITGLWMANSAGVPAPDCTHRLHR